jgi:hypothetical protein
MKGIGFPHEIEEQVVRYLFAADESAFFRYASCASATTTQAH